MQLVTAAHSTAGWAQIQRDWCPCRKRGLRRRPGDEKRLWRKDGHVMMERGPGAMRPQLGAGGGRGQPPGPPRKPTLADPFAWDFHSPNCEKRGFCRVRPPACSNSSQQPRGAGRLVCLDSLDHGPSSVLVTADTALPGEGPPLQCLHVAGEVSRELSQRLEDRALPSFWGQPFGRQVPCPGPLAPSVWGCGGVCAYTRLPSGPKGMVEEAALGLQEPQGSGHFRAASLGVLLARVPRIQTPCRYLVRLKYSRCGRLREGATSSSPGGPRGRTVDGGLSRQGTLGSLQGKAHVHPSWPKALPTSCRQWRSCG